MFQPWDDTLKRVDELGLTPVPMLFHGSFSDVVLRSIEQSFDKQKQEGFVICVSSASNEAKMNTHLAKYVRKGHVQTGKYWMHSQIIKNELK